MINQLFDKYYNLLYKGLNYETDEFYKNAIVRKEMNKDGEEETKYYYPLNEKVELGYDDFLNIRPNLYADALLEDTKQLLNTTPIDNLEIMASEYRIYCGKLLDQFDDDSIKKGLIEYKWSLISILSNIDSLFKSHFKNSKIEYESILPPPREGLFFKKESSNPKHSHPKIKWLANINVLGTLFYEMLNGQDEGEPLIQANKADVVQFLLNNFCNKDGKELSKETIETIFRLEKVDKRANIGDRIELGNVKR